MVVASLAWEHSAPPACWEQSAPRFNPSLEIITISDGSGTKAVQAVVDHMFESLEEIHRTQYMELFIPLLRYARGGTDLSDAALILLLEYPSFIDNEVLIRPVVRGSVDGERHHFRLKRPY